MNHVQNKGGEEVKAPDTPSHTSTGAEGGKDVLQLLKERSIKMEKLARALSVIQQGMLRNKCLLESGVEIQKLVFPWLIIARS